MLMKDSLPSCWAPDNIYVFTSARFNIYFSESFLKISQRYGWRRPAIEPEGWWCTFTVIFPENGLINGHVFKSIQLPERNESPYHEIDSITVLFLKNKIMIIPRIQKIIKLFQILHSHNDHPSCIMRITVDNTDVVQNIFIDIHYLTADR